MPGAKSGGPTITQADSAFSVCPSAEGTVALIEPSHMSSNQPSLFAYSSSGAAPGSFSVRPKAPKNKRWPSGCIWISPRKLIGVLDCASTNCFAPTSEIATSPGIISRLRLSATEAFLRFVILGAPRPSNSFSTELPVRLGTSLPTYGATLPERAPLCPLNEKNEALRLATFTRHSILGSIAQSVGQN